MFGTEVANVTTGAKAPEQALADGNAAVEEIMRNAGYYNQDRFPGDQAERCGCPSSLPPLPAKPGEGVGASRGSKGKEEDRREHGARTARRRRSICCPAPAEGRAQQRDWIRWAFLLPTVLLLFVITIYPMLNSLWNSLHYYNLLAPDDIRFVGLGNYVDLLRKDPTFWVVMQITFIYTIGVVAFSSSPARDGPPARPGHARHLLCGR